VKLYFSFSSLKTAICAATGFVAHSSKSSYLRKIGDCPYFYGEFDGGRKKRVLVKIIGE
jgi:hypothetical protein